MPKRGALRGRSNRCLSKIKGVEIDPFKEDTMDNLVRLALLGSRKAQEEITNRGEFLPCWCCGSDEVNFVNDRGFQIKCQKCKRTGKAGSLLNAMKNWNTRPSVLPSLVLCKDCKYRCNCSNYIGETGVFGDYDFCSMGERKDDHE